MRVSSDCGAAQQVTAWKVFSLAWPALVVLAAPSLYLLFDTAVIGRLGAVELAALAAGVTVIVSLTGQLTFLSYGTTARAARLYGAGRRAEAVYEGVQATWIAVGIGSLLSICVYMAAPYIVSFLASDPVVVHEGIRWLRVACFSILPILLTMAGNGWLRGIGNTRLPLVFTLAGVFPMAVVLPWSVSRWGIVGSAYANIMGEAVTACGFLFCLAYMLRRSRVTGTSQEDATHSFAHSIRPSWRIILQQLILARDLLVRSLSLHTAFVVAAAVAGNFGTAQLAAHQVLLQLWNFLTLVLDSVAIAAQSLVGAALGAGNYSQSRKVAWIVLRFSVVMSIFLAGILFLSSDSLMALFTHDEYVLRAMAAPWWLLLVLLLLGGVVFAFDGVLLGAADAAFLRTITIAAVLCGFIPLVIMSWFFHWGLFGVWCGLVASMMIRAVAVVWRYMGDRWLQ